MISAHHIRPGTLLVFNDVALDDVDYQRLLDQIVTMCGHDQFLVLRIGGGDPPVRAINVRDLLHNIQEDSDL